LPTAAAACNGAADGNDKVLNFVEFTLRGYLIKMSIYDTFQLQFKYKLSKKHV